MKLRGRENSHHDIAMQVFQEVQTQLQGVGVAGPLQKEGRFWHQIWQAKS
jgi:translation initiation factor IF-3